MNTTCSDFIEAVYCTCNFLYQGVRCFRNTACIASVVVGLVVVSRTVPAMAPSPWASGGVVEEAELARARQ